MYTILDFKAVIKHAYYGCDDREAIHCEETDRRFATWQAAALGFLDRYILPLLEEGNSTRHLITAHDMGRDYRTAVYSGYKAKRAERVRSPVEIEQLDKLETWAKQFLASIGSTQIGVKGVEADDVIAWLCQRITDPKTVRTVDADLLQLANDNTIVYLKHEPFYGEGEHKDVPFHLTSLAKSILGDASDGYPGVKGIGPKKWEDLRENFGDDGLQQLQDIVSSGDTTLLEEAIEETGDKTLIKLLENFGDWRTMWRLARLNPELCWKPRAKKLIKPVIHKRVPDANRAYQLLVDVGAKDVWDETFSDVLPSQIAITSDNWEDYREAILDEMTKGDIVAFDYETTDRNQIESFRAASTKNFVDVLSQELTGASFCFGEHLENVIYIPIDHKDSPNLPKSVIAELLEHAGKHSIRVAHNATFEGVVTQTNLNMELLGVRDTRIMQRYYDENSEAGLKAISLMYLGYEQASYEETLAAGNGGEGVNSMAELTLEEAFSYGADDAQVTALNYDLLKLLLQLDEQWDFYQQWAVDPTVILQHSYIKGVKINWKLQAELHERDLKQVDEGLEELRALLEANVTGEITEGCKSFIEAEKDYIYRAARAKADGDKEAASTAVYEWRTRQERACQYIPYRMEEIMPRFALTAKQLTAAAEAVGLPAVEKVTQKYIGEYLADANVVGFSPEWPEDTLQAEFLKSVLNASTLGAFSLKSLANKLEKAEESGDERKITLASTALTKAQESFDELGAVVQRLAGIEPKEVKHGDELNVNSPIQMQQLLYCKIGVPVSIRGSQLSEGRKKLNIRDASPSTDETAILTAMANDVDPDSWQAEALKVLLKVKSANTRVSLYHKKYPMWEHLDGNIHPSITDFGTDTGRPTGSAPNVLQVSAKDREMRSQFLPPTPDHVCVAIDYSGQELRLLACESGDPVMIDAYNPADEKDLHSVTGAGIAALKAAKASGDARAELTTLSDFVTFNTARKLDDHPLNAIASAIRGHAKNVNFGLAYGAGPPTVSRSLIVPLSEAEELLGGAMALYARVPLWQKETAKFMERNGFTLTAFGTKRHATDDIFSKDHGKVSRQHRQGTNSTIQGTAAEMLRIVLTKMVQRNMIHKYDMVFFAPIYDEVVAFVHKDDVVAYCSEMDEIMKSATPPTHQVPQMPEFSIGPDWGRVHELGRWPGDEKIQAAVERSLQEAVEIWEEMESAA